VKKTQNRNEWLKYNGYACVIENTKQKCMAKIEWLCMREKNKTKING
jgi:hypothetical protein